MNKKLMELLDSINAKKDAIKNLVEAGKFKEAADAKNELVEMQAQFDTLKDLYDKEGDAENKNPVPKGTPENDAVHEFANAARQNFRVSNSMNEGTAADGGYTVPEDIQTRINTYREAKESLIDYVDVENVTTDKGSRTFKKRAQQTGFQKVGEGGKIQGKETPQFERLDYDIDKYAGYFPVTNELLNDTDANLTAVLSEWIGNESRVTRNNIICAKIKEKTVTELKDLDDIKKQLNVTLGAAFKNTSKVFTNDDGLQYLDTLKDANGRDLLQPSPTEPAKLQLRAGATIVPLVVFPNADLPSNVATKGKRIIPMIIGDLKEGIKFFDRQKTTIMASNIAVAGELNAFEQDLTLYRAMEREDCKVKDDTAFVNGQITITDATVTGA